MGNNKGIDYEAPVLPQTGGAPGRLLQTYLMVLLQKLYVLELLVHNSVYRVELVVNVQENWRKRAQLSSATNQNIGLGDEN